MDNKTKKPLVSIIIPIHNASKYIGTALKSLIHQTYKNIEIICVDDGSSDNSVEIIKKYKQNDERIILIQQENLFAGVARNTGLKISSGDFIIFLDADDYFNRSMIKSLVKIMTKKNPEIIIFNYKEFSKNKLFKNKKTMKYKNVMKSAKDLKYELFQVTIGAPWNKFYKKSFITSSGLQFQDTLNSNDIFFTRMTISIAKKIYFYDKKFVNYRVYNSKSLQGNVNKSPISFSKALLAIYEEMTNRGVKEYFKDSFEQYAIDLCINAFERVKNKEEMEKIYKACKKNVETFNILENNEYANKIDAKELIHGLINDDRLEIALFMLFYTKKISISRKTIEYRIGQTVLKLLHIKDK